GVALLNSNDLQKGLTRVYEESSTYYSLGVNLSNLGGVGYRKVSVEVTRPGYTARSRRGYAVLPPEELAKVGTRAALLTTAAYSSVPVQLKVAPPVKGKKLYDIPLTVLVPASALTFLPEGDKSKASAEIYVGAIDDSGYTSDIGRDVTTFTMPANASPTTPLA